MRKKRVLWLFNDLTMMNSGAVILEKLGFEIYLPKIPMLNHVAVVTWEFDNYLSISDIEKNTLNKVDFYNSHLNSDIINILNMNFDYIFIDVYVKSFNSILFGYSGYIIIVPFSPKYKGDSLVSTLMETKGIHVLNHIQHSGNQIWIGNCGCDMRQENSFFQCRILKFPFIVPQIEDNEKERNEKLLFFCPEVKIDKISGERYDRAARELEKLEVVLGGRQSQTCYSKMEVLDVEEKDFGTYKFLFCFDDSYFYLDDFIIEALKNRMIIIFRGKGWLYNAGCRTAHCEEGKVAIKYKRLLRNKKMQDKVLFEQEKILEKLTCEKSMKVWNESFSTISEFEQCNKGGIVSRKIAVLIPAEYKGGVLEYSVNLIKALKRGNQKCGLTWNFVLGYLKGSGYEDESWFREIQEEGIEIREYVWEEFYTKRLQSMMDILEMPGTAKIKSQFIPNDSIRFFEDCDYFFFTSNHVPKNLCIMKPYFVILHDYIDRYNPIHSNNCNFEFVRKAERCFTTTFSTKVDAVQYAGISDDKIQLLPLFFSAVRKTKIAEEKAMKYFIWPTNVSKHKNHIKMLLALEKYYARGGKLKCYMTGSETKSFSYTDSVEIDKVNKIYSKAEANNSVHKQERDLYTFEVRKIILRNDHLRKNIVIKGELPFDNYIELLEDAAFMIHPGYADNGNGAAFFASMLSVPVLSNDYWPMRNMDAEMKLNMLFFDISDTECVVERMLYAEKNNAELKSKLPGYEELLQHTIEDESLCKAIFKIVSGV